MYMDLTIHLDENFNHKFDSKSDQTLVKWVHHGHRAVRGEDVPGGPVDVGLHV